MAKKQICIFNLMQCCLQHMKSNLAGSISTRQVCFEFIQETLKEANNTYNGIVVFAAFTLMKPKSNTTSLVISDLVKYSISIFQRFIGSLL